MNNYLGANFVLDRPSAGGNQGFLEAISIQD